MTSSIRRIITAASEALEIACVFTRSGSMTPALSISTGLPSNTSSPKFFFPPSCAARIATSISMASSPAFSARVRGMISRAAANASIASWTRPPSCDAYFLNWSESSVSGAPPPATIFFPSTTTLITISASWIARSSSSTTCCVPPRTIMETALGFLHSET